MIRVPIIFNEDYSAGVIGTVEMTPELEAIYSSESSNYLVINPILRVNNDGTQELIAFGVYPMPVEPTVEKKKRGRPKKVE